MTNEPTELIAAGIQARVAWRSKITGFEGHGEFTNVATARAWVEQGNREFPDTHHWLEYKQSAVAG